MTVLSSSMITGGDHKEETIGKVVVEKDDFELSTIRTTITRTSIMRRYM